MATGAAAAIAAAVGRARREIHEHYEQVGAFDPEHGVGYDPRIMFTKRNSNCWLGAESFGRQAMAAAGLTWMPSALWRSGVAGLRF